ncbi:MAG TPA: hypothetical protein VMA09_00315 [Candidatus Binataceae bacterium]|nr:hypothetical protein [Candidatus Binataceae bacterium]
MKLWKVAVAAMFALFMFAMPGRASAEWYPSHPVPVTAPAARYYPAGYYGAPYYPAWNHGPGWGYGPAWGYGRPLACNNPWFRHHHRACW